MILVADEGVDALTDAKAGEALFRTADAALYAAKARGRNQVFVAPETTAHALYPVHADVRA